MSSLIERYNSLLEPSDVLINDLQKLDGDIIILGAGGKMGPALARLAKAAVDKAGVEKNVIAVSRFSEAGLEDELRVLGIITYNADLLEENQLRALPDVTNVLYLAGTKFGTQGNESFTWAMNSYLPGRAAEKYKNSRIVAFSTGNVYPLTPVSMGGATETNAPAPIGEYAQSCLGRERLFQYSALKNNTPTLIYRLNYANDTRYGVLVDIAKAVQNQQRIDLSMGYVNVIWQGDANEIALRCLHHCAVPAAILNVTGPSLLSVRWIAEKFAKLFGKDPVFINTEEPDALLSDATKCCSLFGEPKVSVEDMIDIIAAWIMEGRKLLNKETHFQERTGNF